VLGKRKADKVAREDIKRMQSHTINLFLRENKQRGQESIVILGVEQREVGGRHAKGKHFWLKEPMVTGILHVVCRSSEEGGQLFVRLWLETQRKRLNGISMRKHVNIISSVECTKECGKVNVRR